MNPIVLIQALFVELFEAIEAMLEEFHLPSDSLVRYTLTKLRENATTLYEQMRTYYNALIDERDAAQEKASAFERQLYDSQTENTVLKQDAERHYLQLQSWMKLVPLSVLIPSASKQADFALACDKARKIDAVKLLRETQHEFGHLGLKETITLYELRFKKQPEISLTIRGSHGDFGVDSMGVPTGKIPDAYKNIVEVNIGEYSQWLREKCGEELKKGDETHILLVEYWYRDDNGMKHVERPDYVSRSTAEEKKSETKPTEG